MLTGDLVRVRISKERVIPFYLAAFAIWGWWREARILTTLYPILIPLLLAYCYALRFKR